MRYLLTVIIFMLNGLHASEIVKEGIIPLYNPHEAGICLYFVPYNAQIIVAGERIFSTVCGFANTRECTNVYCLTPDENEYARLSDHAIRYPNVYPFLGLPHDKPEGKYPYYLSRHATAPYEDFFRLSGSFLPPVSDAPQYFLKESSTAHAYDLLAFCADRQLSKVHVLCLDCGGNEAAVLQNALPLLQDMVVVMVKTYHQPYRIGQCTFDEVNHLLEEQDFVLLSHYIQNRTVGNALYIKRKYFRAVFQSKEI